MHSLKSTLKIAALLLILSGAGIHPGLAQGSPEDLYQQGSRALDRDDWSAAAEAFAQVAASEGSRADAALYWRAYALEKQGDHTAALDSLARLGERYEDSAWSDDAAALRVEIQQAQGSPVAPQELSRAEIRILALAGLIHTDEERVVRELQPYLEGDHPPQVQQQALFLLAQGSTPEARRLLAKIARNDAAKALQLRAVKALGVMGDDENLALLEEVYDSSKSREIREAILHSYMMAGDEERLLKVARQETDAELRAAAIRWLGSVGSLEGLRELYRQAGSDADKEAVLRSLGAAGDLDELARITGSPTAMREIRVLAAQVLGSLRGEDEEELETVLVGLYDGTTDPEVRRRLLDGLFIQDRDQALIAIARQETNPDLIQAALQHLSSLGTPAAIDYLMERTQ